MPVIAKFFNIFLPRTRLNNSLRILISANASMVFVIGLFAPFYTVFIQKIGGGVFFAGVSWGLFSIVAGLLTIFFTKWELKIKEPELMVALGYAIRGVVFISYAFMGSIAQLVFTQVLWGIGAAIGVPAFESVYSSHTDKEISIAQWGSWEGVANIMTGVAAIAGGALIQGFGYQTMFLIMSVIAFLLAVYLWRLPREVL